MNRLEFCYISQDAITGLYDHGARSRDPKLTMWYGVDPLFEKYPDISPYAYCMGNPVRFVDPDGRGVYKIEINGELYYEFWDSDKPFYVSEDGLTWTYFSMGDVIVDVVPKKYLWSRFQSWIMGNSRDDTHGNHGYGDGNGSDAPGEKVKRVDGTQDNSNFQRPIGDTGCDDQKVKHSRFSEDEDDYGKVVVSYDTTVTSSMIPETENRPGYSKTTYIRKSDTTVIRQLSIGKEPIGSDTIYTTK